MATQATAAALISKERTKRNLSQREFSTALGLPSHQIIDKWEKGSVPDTDTLIKVWLHAPDQWARDLGFYCLDARYPGVFINPKPLGAGTDSEDEPECTPIEAV